MCVSMIDRSLIMRMRVGLVMRMIVRHFPAVLEDEGRLFSGRCEREWLSKAGGGWPQYPAITCMGENLWRKKDWVIVSFIYVYVTGGAGNQCNRKPKPLMIWVEAILSAEVRSAATYNPTWQHFHNGIKSIESLTRESTCYMALVLCHADQFQFPENF